MNGSTTKKRSRLADWGLLLGVVLVCLLIVEFTVRGLMGDRIVLFPRNHAEARYGDYVIRRLTPGLSFWHESIDGRWHFTTNAQGFRADRDFTYDKPAGVFRVLVLGDSHTQGFEVHQNESYSAVLEKLLRDRGIKAEVINAGVSGFGTAEQLVMLENEGLRYKPDAVVVGFFANDYEDSARSGLFRFEGGKLVEGVKTYAPAVRVIRWTQAIPGLKWLGENSYAYSLLFNFVWDFMKTLSAREATREYAVKVDTVSGSMEDLSAALLKRLAAAAQKAGSVAILADIPQIDGATGWATSLPANFRAQVTPAFQHFVPSEQYLAGLPAGEVVHVRHGHRHINAATHARLAAAIDKALAASGTPAR